MNDLKELATVLIGTIAIGFIVVFLLKFIISML